MSPVRRFAAGALAAVVVILATALPASAHDSLTSSTPETDERLSAPPDGISLTFSGELLTLGDSMTGAVVLVVDEEGREWADGDAVVNGNSVTLAVKPGMPEAGYQVRWQVISEDGHPISGVIPFTIGDAAPMKGEQAGTGGANPPSTTTDQAADEADGAVRTLLVAAGGAAVAAIAYLLYRFLRRRKATAAAPDEGDPADSQL
ncbi:MAG: copper resistance protein CopC [Microbacterium sp.]|uniref:Methionine-rich copper-binding protein CopC n=1 Tax=Microbacterium natoriense TaxID=284570 RepID=A0AAW8ET15_9MICO|nr:MULTISPECIES: copper resistance CopC family protein [Microbacterium]MBW8762319.1 copper resistance protein CopC [Microbacterium sp.]MDQ0646373.1 methionine-rich copper-binding protein CopC [Microbacterium natoriense]